MTQTASSAINSMTAFASAKGEHDAHSWSWEMRSVNAKGLDLRLRVPDWLEGLEAGLRSDLSKRLARGNVNLTLRISRTDDGGGALSVNEQALTAMLEAIRVVESRAAESNVDLTPTRAADILALRGVLDTQVQEDDNTVLLARLRDQFTDVVSAFLQMRASEGAALSEILQSQLAQVETCCAAARDVVEARKQQMADTMRANLNKVLDNTDGLDPDRVLQELALIAVKADVTEELDRLDAHVIAARDLLTKGGAVGRKLDFLMQEFNREANTLCSKAQNRDLTAVGLELKAVIDQMREQVQNVE